MLQWKPRLVVLLVLVVLAAVALGQFTWESVYQLTW